MITLASIDVGSNTIRLLIVAVEGSRIADIHSARRITRLGNNVHQTGTLQDRNMEDSIAVLKEFSSAISHFGVYYTKAVGTSALREATNADLFIKKAFGETGILIDVISGEQEAALTLKGILASLPMAGYTIPESTLILDMGGGSTEWISIQKNHAAGTSPAVLMGTIPLGVIKLAQKYVQAGPVSEYDIHQMTAEIDPVLQDLKAGNRANTRRDMPYRNRRHVYDDRICRPWPRTVFTGKDSSPYHSIQQTARHEEQTVFPHTEGKRNGEGT